MLLNTVTLVAPDGASVTLGWQPPGDLDFLLDVADVGGIEHTADVRDRPTEAGAYDFRTRAGARQVRLAGRIVGSSPAHTRQLARKLSHVAARVGVSDHLVRIRWDRDGSQVEASGRLVGRAEFGPDDEAPNLWETFDLIFTCPDPLAYATGETVVALTPLPGTLTSNAGAQVWPTVTVAGPTSGTTTELTVGNQTVGRRLELSGLTLSYGSVVEVVCAPGREFVTVDGVPALDRLSVASRFFPVRSGDQRLYVTVLGGSGLTAEARYRTGWAD